MKPNLLKSRKFWIMIADITISTAVYFVGFYVKPEIGNNILWLIGSWQPVIYAVINGITTEDSAVITAAGITDSASIAAK